MKDIKLEGLNITKTRLLMVVSLITLLLGVYSTYSYLIAPLQIEKQTLNETITALEPRIRDISALNTQLEEARAEVSKKEAEVLKMKESDKYKSVSYLDYLATIGEIEQKSGVNLVSVVESEPIQKGSYWEIPYNIVVAGEYPKILTFVNGIYNSDRFHVTTNVKMNNGSGVLTSDKNLILNENWATEIKNNITKNYPSQSNNTEPQSDGTTPQENSTEPEILYLDFSFKFIAIDNLSNQ